MRPSHVLRVGTVLRVADRDWIGVVCLHGAIIWKDTAGTPVAGCGKCFRVAKRLREEASAGASR